MEINDKTDAFDTRLQAMERSQLPRNEIDSAMRIYERLRSARAIATALLSPPINGNDRYQGEVSEAAVLAVFNALCAEVMRASSSYPGMTDPGP